jgi:nicotinamidase-related amidase
VKAIAEEVKLLDHLRALVAAAREKGIRIHFVPHHRYEPGDYVEWLHATPYQLAGAERQVFAKGSWGGTFHDDFQPQKGDARGLSLPLWAAGYPPQAARVHRSCEACFSNEREHTDRVTRASGSGS